MRQIFLLLFMAMGLAFSLSWALPQSDDSESILPDAVVLPDAISLKERPQILATFTLKDNCESLDSVEHEIQGNRIIVDVKTSHPANRLCLQKVRTNVPLEVVIDDWQPEADQQPLEVYFREGDSLKYYGTIEIHHRAARTVALR